MVAWGWKSVAEIWSIVLLATAVVFWFTTRDDPQLAARRKAGIKPEPISAMLEKVYGIRIARIEQSIQAVRLGKRQAKLLRATDGGPALRAIRRYYDQNGRLIELSNAIHPGERFTYTTSLVRS
ncbi:UTRA domain protein [compost metagenome]